MEKKIDSIVVGDIQTNCWFYLLDEAPAADGRRPCAVIDPGAEAEAIVSRLRELNWVPRYILLTHGHFDHVGGVAQLIEACKKGECGDIVLPEIGIHRLEAHYLGAAALDIQRNTFASVGGDPNYISALWSPLPDADILFEEGDTIGPFKVLHVPGHTPGSVCYYDEKGGFLFSGDTLFESDYGRTDMPGGNYDQLCQSLKRLLTLNHKTIVCPGHDVSTTIGQEQNLRF